MVDVIYVGAVVVAFAVLYGVVRLCDRLVRPAVEEATRASAPSQPAPVQEAAGA